MTTRSWWKTGLTQQQHRYYSASVSLGSRSTCLWSSLCAKKVKWVQHTPIYPSFDSLSFWQDIEYGKSLILTPIYLYTTIPYIRLIRPASRISIHISSRNGVNLPCLPFHSIMMCFAYKSRISHHDPWQLFLDIHIFMQIGERRAHEFFISFLLRGAWWHRFVFDV
jgi:hypothetical protein